MLFSGLVLIKLLSSDTASKTLYKLTKFKLQLTVMFVIQKPKCIMITRHFHIFLIDLGLINQQVAGSSFGSSVSAPHYAMFCSNYEVIS